MEQQREYVGDLHRRRSVIVRITESGEVLETVRACPETGLHCRKLRSSASPKALDTRRSFRNVDRSRLGRWPAGCRTRTELVVRYTLAVLDGGRLPT